MNTYIKIIALATLLLANLQLFAQQIKEIKNNEIEGIYLTTIDFKSGHLTIQQINYIKETSLNYNIFLSHQIFSALNKVRKLFSVKTVFLPYDLLTEKPTVL